MLAADMLLPVPSTVVGSLLGARLGLLPGWLFGWIGLVTGNTIGFAVGRLLPSPGGVHVSEPPTGLLVFVTRPIPILAEALPEHTARQELRLSRPICPTLLKSGRSLMITALQLLAARSSLIPPLEPTSALSLI